MAHRFPLLCLFLVLLAAVAPRAAEAQSYTLNEELMYRINFGRTDDVKLLLSKGANPNARNVQGDPALSVAIDRQDSEAPNMVKALLDKGADPNIPNAAKIYPIMRAVNNSQADLVEALLRRGANYDIKNAKGVSLLDLAHQAGNQRVIFLVQQATDEKANYEALLRSAERFKTVIRFYRFHSCEYQYWSYFKGSRQEPEHDAATDAKINDHKIILVDLLRQVQKYFPATRTSYLESISNEAAGQIYSYMDSLISNRNRAEHGIGRDSDAETRCWKIAG